MTASFKPAPLLLALALLGSAAATTAQEPVLREGQVTEKSLIDALAPASAASGAAGESAPRMRGFKPMIRPTAALAGTAATAATGTAGAGRASILVTFVTDSAALTPQAKRALDVLASALKSEQLAGKHFEIQGNADPRGSEAHNLQLSQERAEAVRAYLVSQQGLRADRLTAVGKGSTELMNPNDPAAPENRRVTIVAQP
ncbi:MAG: OmpA family protein [Burkholderiales bacterium]|nr:OmpA family protein [Burkholderiales bacterium]